ncbi:MAG: FAD-dependent oxidoreductase [Candidatus Pacearchaeota archaeon]
MSYDLIIVGAGPAGLTAGLYAVRSGLKTAIVSKDIGGTANSILLLENWPGFNGNGTKLMKSFYDQLKEYKINFFMNDVEMVEKKENLFIVKTNKEELKSKALIIATGTERRKLNVKGEKELTGRGVSYCVTCDAFFFKGKDIAVIGGSNCAATSALALSDLAKKVFIIYRGEKLRCEDITSKRLENKNNVEVFYNSIPVEIKGKDNVEGIIVETNGKKKEIKLDGIFVEIGSTPLIKFLKDLNLKLDGEKYIIVDGNMKTNIKGLFAAGDITNHKLKQVVVASGHGAIAAKSAYEYISKKE